MKQNKLIWAGALLAAAVLFSACAGKPENPSASTAGEATEAPAGTVDTTPETEDPIDYDALGRSPADFQKVDAAQILHVVALVAFRAEQPTEELLPLLCG